MHLGSYRYLKTLRMWRSAETSPSTKWLPYLVMLPSTASTCCLLTPDLRNSRPDSLSEVRKSARSSSVTLFLFHAAWTIQMSPRIPPQIRGIELGSGRGSNLVASGGGEFTSVSEVADEMESTGGILTSTPKILAKTSQNMRIAMLAPYWHHCLS